MPGTKRKYPGYTFMVGGKAVKFSSPTIKKRLGPVLGSTLSRGYGGSFGFRRGPELKTVDNSTITAAPVSNTTGNITLLNGIATGTDYTNRVGRKVVMKSLLLRVNFFPYTTGTIAALAGENLRFLVVYDCQPNGALPAITDILNSAGPNEPNNLNQRDRFKVIADFNITTPSFTTTTGALTLGSPRMFFKKIYKKMNMDVIFNGTGSTVASIQTGSLVVAQISGNQYYSSIYTSRVRFVDQ